MASPSAEAPDPTPTIVFQHPIGKPDVRIIVFKQEFHVHSTMLKMTSAFFRKFLDSPDKDHTEASSREFKYNYISVTDADGQWGLEPASTADTSLQHGLNPSLLDGNNEEDEQDAFRKLLCALYNREYSTCGVHEVKALVRLADFYCALPAVSSTLHNDRLCGLSYMFQIEACDLFRLAKKLHCAPLFRRCLARLAADKVNLVGLLKLFGKDDLELITIILDARIDILDRVVSIEEKIHRLSSMYEQETLVAEVQSELRGPFHKAVKPAVFFTSLYAKFSIVWKNSLVLQDLRDILKNPWNLESLDEVELPAGSIEHFFCAEIKDADLPWDLEAIDW